MKMNKKCVICNEDVEKFGHNPQPIKQEGRCCEKCNYGVVINARVKELKNKTYRKEELETDLNWFKELGIERKEAKDYIHYLLNKDRMEE
jgi:hypothetical protein